MTAANLTPQQRWLDGARGDCPELETAEELTCSACGDEISEREWTEHGGRCYCCGREPKEAA